MQDFLSIIREPITAELEAFNDLFQESLSHSDGTLTEALQYIRQKVGKRMRPMLILLTAKAFGKVTEQSLHAAIALELLHTASLVHDDVVDEAHERRGQRSINAIYDNRIAVLIGDYILATALVSAAKSGSNDSGLYLSQLGQRLANGEIAQMTSNDSEEISEEAYYRVIRDKTASLFEACCAMGAISVGATEDNVEAAKQFGRTLGMIFQIRDDIFDYFDTSDIGKPTGNDMAEGKLTLPAIHAVQKAIRRQDEPTGTTEEKNYASKIVSIARKVKQHSANAGEIARLVQYTKESGGIEYAEAQMQRMHTEAMRFINERVGDQDIRRSLTAYLDYCIKRNL